MHIHLKKLFAVVAPAAILIISGVSAATASTTGTRSGASGTEHFEIISAAPNSNSFTAIFYGVFTAGGTSTNNVFKLHGGTFRIAPKLGKMKTSFNPKTCLLQISAPATYTLKDGTGKYAGIRGSGHAEFSLLGITARTTKGACSMTKSTVRETVIDGSGPVHI
jgi:hypothetical protein